MNQLSKFPAATKRIALVSAPSVERDPKRPGYCHAYALQFTNERLGKYQDGEAHYAFAADAEADAAVCRTRKVWPDDEVTVRRIYTSVEGLHYAPRHVRSVAA